MQGVAVVDCRGSPEVQLGQLGVETANGLDLWAQSPKVAPVFHASYHVNRAVIFKLKSTGQAPARSLLNKDALQVAGTLPAQKKRLFSVHLMARLEAVRDLDEQLDGWCGKPSKPFMTALSLSHEGIVGMTGPAPWWMGHCSLIIVPSGKQCPGV